MTPGARRLLQAMADAEREAERTGEWEAAELVCEGWQVGLGLERFHRSSVNQLLEYLAIRALPDIGETLWRFQISDTGRAILRRPQLEQEIRAALLSGQPFTIKGNRIAALRNAPSYLGRGHEATPGKPLGWSWHRERDEIREHLQRRGWLSPDLEFRVTCVQERIHRYKPTFHQRQEVARAAGERWVSPAPVPPPRGPFSQEELERLADLFAEANDPVTASIGRKAAAMLPTSQIPKSPI